MDINMFDQGPRNDLPGQSVFVFQPAALYLAGNASNEEDRD